jgi:hypothetical protein
MYRCVVERVDRNVQRGMVWHVKSTNNRKKISIIAAHSNNPLILYLIPLNPIPSPSPPTPTPSPLPPFLPSPIPHNTFPASQIPIAQQSSNINIERRIRLRIRQQLLNRSQRRRQRIHRTPVLGRQQSKTYGAIAERNIGVRDLRREVDCRR